MIMENLWVEFFGAILFMVIGVFYLVVGDEVLRLLIFTVTALCASFAIAKRYLGGEEHG